MSDLKTSLDKKDLKNSLLFRGIDLEPVIDQLKDCPVRELKKGTVLIHAGKPNRFLYLVLSGRLRIHVENLDLEPIAILEPGEIAGELSIIDSQVTSASAVAHENCRLLELDEKSMWSLVEDSHAVARNLLFILSRRLRQGNALIGASLLEKVSDLELEEFQPQEVPESKGKLEEKSENETVRLYNAATAYVSESIRKAQKKKSPDRAQGEKLVKLMIDSIAESPALLLLATDRTQEFAVSPHSVNVTLLALRLAQTLDYEVHNQIKVGLAALLHELGVALLPRATSLPTRAGESAGTTAACLQRQALENVLPERRLADRNSGASLRTNQWKRISCGIGGRADPRGSTNIGYRGCF